MGKYVGLLRILYDKWQRVYAGGDSKWLPRKQLASGHHVLGVE